MGDLQGSLALEREELLDIRHPVDTIVYTVKDGLAVLRGRERNVNATPLHG
jgi:hypothetical protein